MRFEAETSRADKNVCPTNFSGKGKMRLEELNRMTEEKAEAALLACCGSRRWARALAARRPLQDKEQLLRAADGIWGSVGREDWLEAFRCHPRIGEKTIPPQRRPSTSLGAGRERREDAEKEAGWSEEEQAGARGASGETRAALAEANRAYEARFGYIFIVCATGKSAEEMLALLRQRLQNDPDAELRIAAEQQRQITHLRLEKLLEA